MKAARTILLPVQYPLLDSAGGCWKGVKPVGFISLEAVASLYKEAGMDGGRAMCDSAVPTLCRVLGMGTGLVALATPGWGWEAGS